MTDLSGQTTAAENIAAIEPRGDLKNDRNAWMERALEAERLLAQRDRAVDELSDKYSALAADQNEAAYYRGVMIDITNSVSWRITAPIRALKARFNAWRLLARKGFGSLRSGR